MIDRVAGAIGAALLWLACTGCEQTAAKDQGAMVLAAASLTAPFIAMVSEFERAHPEHPVQLVFDGTPQLLVKLREGAAGDVLAAADAANMQKVVDAGQTAAAPSVFAKNVLTIVTARGNPKGIRTLADLANLDLEVLLCGPEVPAGRYAREALHKAGATVHSVSDEPSVKAVVSKMQLGEADAGIVYVTDAAAVADKLTAVAIPDEHNVVATYPIAVLSTGKSRAAGEAFVAFVHSARGQRVLQSFGFRSP